MQDVRKDFNLHDCCIAVGEARYLERFPLELGAEDTLRDLLLTAGKNWGPITQAATQGIFIRTASREVKAGGGGKPYFDAEVETLRCPQGHDFAYALLGRRVYYLAWRLHLISLSFFQGAEHEPGRTAFFGDDDWPGPEQVDQLRLALRMYLDDSSLSNEGFRDLYKWTLEAPPALALQFNFVSELALLFILLHEVQHVMEAFYARHPDKPPMVQVGLELEGLGNRQRQHWTAEMQADCNAWFMLLQSVATVMLDKYALPGSEARVMAFTLAGQAADLVLHALEFVERQRFGRLDAEMARSMPQFLTHPPCDTRRKALSYTSYEQVTKRPYTELFEQPMSNEWRQIASECGAHINIRERLYTAAEE